MLATSVMKAMASATLPLRRAFQTAGARLGANASTDEVIGDVEFQLHAINTGRELRIVAATATALIGQIWLGWAYAITVILAVIAYEFYFLPHVFRRRVRDRLRTHTDKALRDYGLTVCFGATVYAVCWGGLLVSGEAIPSYAAACWFSSAIIHGGVYYSHRLDFFAAAIVPHVLVAIAAPFLSPLSLLGVIVACLASLLSVANIFIVMADRNRLAQRALTERIARDDAVSANVAKSQFLATMSHELRTPLNAIIGYAEIIEEDLEIDENTTANAEDARRIRRAARHLLTLINEVLDLSKIEAGRLELTCAPVDVAAMLADVEETVRPIAASNGNRIAIDIVGVIDPVLTDPDRFKQCLINLATNACKFTSGGRITLRASIDRRNGENVLNVAVEDTGIGISAEDQARLFQPFVQVDASETRRQDGTGLGLAITRKLAHALGGDVSLMSKPGLGSTFTVRIPARLEAQAQPVPKGARLVTVATAYAYEGSAADLRNIVSTLTPDEIAQLLSAMPDGARESLLLLTGAEIPRGMLQHLEPDVRARVLSQFPASRFAGDGSDAPVVGDRRPQVLVIEDDSSAHDLTARALERLPIQVEFADTGRAGLAQLRETRPVLVILDIHLPDMSGWAVLEQIRSLPHARDLPVLVVTIDDDRARSIALGACDHLQKPVDRDRLAAAVMRFARWPDAASQPALGSPAACAATNP